MKRKDWIELYRMLSAGASIKDVIYDDSQAIKDQTKVQLMISRDKFITITITD